MPDLAANLRAVHDAIAAAASAAGRTPEEITLLAVSKTRSAEEVAEAARAGATDFGENYVQELTDKQQTLAAADLDIHWHFIGHLQRNKVRFIVPFCALIHVVDSARLADEIEARAGAIGRIQPVLLQVDLACEETKHGCPEGQVMELAGHLAGLAHVQWQGLMTIPPLAHEAEASRPYYRRLRQWRERLAAEFPARDLRHLSMGMSNDFTVAIEEGATLVRVGTAIFGPRN
jgi:hypothetical protein